MLAVFEMENEMTQQFKHNDLVIDHYGYSIIDAVTPKLIIASTYTVRGLKLSDSELFSTVEFQLRPDGAYYRKGSNRRHRHVYPIKLANGAKPDLARMIEQPKDITGNYITMMATHYQWCQRVGQDWTQLFDHSRKMAETEYQNYMDQRIQQVLDQESERQQELAKWQRLKVEFDQDQRLDWFYDRFGTENHDTIRDDIQYHIKRYQTDHSNDTEAVLKKQKQQNLDKMAMDQLYPFQV